MRECTQFYINGEWVNPSIPNSFDVIKSIGHINGLSRIDILADCVDRARSTVEVFIY
jgi:hypothetical protein